MLAKLAARTLASGTRAKTTAAWCGLGAMGYPMAGLVSSKFDTLVWNRSPERSERHQDQYGTTQVAELDQLGDADVVLMCLPTSEEVHDVVSSMLPTLKRGTVLVDCTSGDPTRTQEIAAMAADADVAMVDCAVSGGPAGAYEGRLAGFVGGKVADVAVAMPAIRTFTQRVVHLGPVGAGHAVKSINNALNVTQLLLASEGLLALQRMGIDPARALEVINASSGRSLMTMERIPNDILTGNFNYGFKHGLMRKDVRIANALLDAHFPEAELMRVTADIMDQAVDNGVSPDGDYTEAVKELERRSGQELRQSNDDLA